MSSQAESLTILVVDDQASSRVAISAMLDDLGHRVIEAADAPWALAQFTRHQPDLVLLDVEMPGVSGYELARQLRAAEPGGWTPIVFLSGLDQDIDLWRGIEAGGDDYLCKPVAPMVLRAKLLAMQRLLRMRNRLVGLTQALQDANARLEHLSSTDPLTGLMNRRALDQRLDEDLARARAGGSPLTLLLCDIDHFKRYNDGLGHLAGDDCIRRVAEVLKACCLRSTDSAARYGGEEFVLVLPGLSRSGALTFARGLLRTIETMQLPHPDSPAAPHVTLSGGLTTCLPDASTTAAGLLLRADEALYTAKSRGRRRLFSFEMQVDAFSHSAAVEPPPARAAAMPRP